MTYKTATLRAANTKPPRPTDFANDGDIVADAETPAALRVLDQLRDMIVKDELKAGSRIVERTLCTKLNVSRTPMREALKLLEIDGLIELSQNRGARVLAFTEAEAVELFEVLASLESLAAELATERMTRSTLSLLERHHKEMARQYERGNIDAYFDLNSKIHALVVEATGNKTLMATHKSLMLRAKRGRYMAILDPGRWQQAMDEHEALIDAVKRRNSADAGRVWRAHLVHTGQTVAAVLRNNAQARAAS